ncbi:MAG: hypothetical protein ABIK36_16300 [Pseudomonadota bacterium]
MYNLNLVQGKYKKPPVRWRNGFSPMLKGEALEIGTFAEVVAAMQSDIHGRHGIGIVLTREAGALCFDADTPDAFGLLDSMNAARRTYCETSISGVGRHYIWLGKLPHDRSALVDKGKGIEVYASDRFIAITGNVLPQGNGHLADASDLFEQMFANVAPPATNIGTDVTTQHGQVQGLSDSRVISVLRDYYERGKQKPLWETICSTDDLTGRRSDVFLRVASDLDRIVGDPAQVWRVMRKMPMIARNGHNAEKFERDGLFDKWIRDGRAGTTQGIPNVTTRDYGDGPSSEHGKAINLGWSRTETSAPVFENGVWALPKPAPVVQTAPPPPPTQFSAMAVRAVRQLTAGILDEKYLHETLPPGLMGTFTNHVMQGMYEPFLKFAIPATLSTTTAIIGRHIKLSDEQGINLMSLVFALTATGKSESLRSANEMLQSIGNPDLRVPDYINSVMIDSRQGGHDVFQKMPSMLWAVDECASLLDMVVNPPKGSSASAVSDLLNKLFEISTVNGVLRRPGSRTAQKAGETDIPNPSVSCYWATTTSNAAKVISREFIDSGLSSRCLPILHYGSAGTSHDDLANRHTRIPDGELKWRLMALVRESCEVQTAYCVAVANDKRVTPEVLRLIRHVGMTPDAQALFDRFRKNSDRFKYDVQNGKGGFPDTYIMLSRVAMLSPRIAATIAYLNGTNSLNGVPRIGIEDLSWAIGYVLKQYAGFLTGFDRNIFGASLGQAEKTVVTVMKELLATGEAARDGMVSKMQLGRVGTMRAPFRGEKDPRDALWRTVKDLIEDDAIEVLRNQGSRQGTFYRPTEHRIWEDS